MELIVFSEDKKNSKLCLKYFFVYSSWVYGDTCIMEREQYQREEEENLTLFYAPQRQLLHLDEHDEGNNVRHVFLCDDSGSMQSSFSGTEITYENFAKRQVQQLVIDAVISDGGSSRMKMFKFSTKISQLGIPSYEDWLWARVSTNSSPWRGCASTEDVVCFTLPESRRREGRREIDWAIDTGYERHRSGPFSQWTCDGGGTALWASAYEMCVEMFRASRENRYLQFKLYIITDGDDNMEKWVPKCRCEKCGLSVDASICIGGGHGGANKVLEYIASHGLDVQLFIIGLGTQISEIEYDLYASLVEQLQGAIAIAHTRQDVYNTQKWESFRQKVAVAISNRRSSPLFPKRSAPNIEDIDDIRREKTKPRSVLFIVIVVIVLLLALFGGYSLLSPMIQNLLSPEKYDQKLEFQRMANREWLEQVYRKLSPEKAKTEDFQVFLDETLARYIADPQGEGLLGLHQNLERKYKKKIKQPPHFGKKLVKDL